jgi:hypothetical protein
MKLLIGLLLITALTSCISYKKYSIEVIKPSHVSLPDDLQKIAIVSRNLKYKTDTLQNYYASGSKLIKDKMRINIDSMAIQIGFDSLADNLRKQNKFNKIKILPVNSFKVQRVDHIRPAQAEWYKQLAEKSDVDGLIVLDMFSCFYSLSNDYETTIAKVVTSNIWSVYHLKSQKIIDRYTQIDTLYWDGMNEKEKYSKTRIPSKNEAIRLASGVIGKNYIEHILPHWTLGYRSIMTNNKAEFKKAADLALQHQWVKASLIWGGFVNSKNNQLRMISNFNLALASEMNGDIEKAIELISIAGLASTGIFLSEENEVVRKYAAVLYQRKIDQQKLKKQDPEL